MGISSSRQSSLNFDEQPEGDDKIERNSNLGSHESGYQFSRDRSEAALRERKPQYYFGREWETTSATAPSLVSHSTLSTFESEQNLLYADAGRVHSCEAYSVLPNKKESSLCECRASHLFFSNDDQDRGDGASGTPFFASPCQETMGYDGAFISRPPITTKCSRCRNGTASEMHGTTEVQLHHYTYTGKPVQDMRNCTSECTRNANVPTQVCASRGIAQVIERRMLSERNHSKKFIESGTAMDVSRAQRQHQSFSPCLPETRRPIRTAALIPPSHSRSCRQDCYRSFHSSPSSLSSSESSAIPTSMSSQRIPHAYRHSDGTWTSPHMMYPAATRPVACPSNHQHRMEEKQAMCTAETRRLYDTATWRMYHRITAARRRKSPDSGATVAPAPKVNVEWSDTTESADVEGAFRDALEKGQLPMRAQDQNEGAGKRSTHCDEEVFALDMDQ